MRGVARLFHCRIPQSTLIFSLMPLCLHSRTTARQHAYFSDGRRGCFDASAEPSFYEITLISVLLPPKNEYLILRRHHAMYRLLSPCPAFYHRRHVTATADYQDFDDTAFIKIFYMTRDFFFRMTRLAGFCLIVHHACRQLRRPGCRRRTPIGLHERPAAVGAHAPDDYHSLHFLRFPPRVVKTSIASASLS